MKLITRISLLYILFFFLGCKKDVVENRQNNFAGKVSIDKGGNGKPQIELRTVRVLYIIPADRTFNKQYYNAIKKAGHALQKWYNAQMNGKTFEFNKQRIEIFQSDKSTAWFSDDNGVTSGGTEFFYFYYNSFNETRNLLGDNMDYTKNVFTVYVDAYGQTGAGVPGFCTMPENDLKGLSGLMSEPVSRWIGGWGHELGHAFGLPHPDGHPDWNIALMGAGYQYYPNSLLLESDKQTLLETGFFY